MDPRFINPFIDYGFKKLFGTEANKDILISFLNAVIEDTADPIVDLTYKNVEMIADLTYKNVEMIGEFNGDKRSYFDVYCQTSSNRQFIVEMQNKWKPFFKDRTLYYAAKAIREQGGLNDPANYDPVNREQADKDDKQEPWDYHLNEVYLIAMMNFRFSKNEYPPEEYYHRVMLTDLKDHHVFYDKLTFIYLEMPKIGKAELDMNRPLDRWLRAIYRLWGGEDCPPELDEPVFKKLYKEAEYACLSPDQQLSYERNVKYYLDIYNEIKGGRILGREEGREEGRILGLEEGRKERTLELAKAMLAMGMDKAIVAKITGLDADLLE